jgi:cytochrome c biogenesis protein CcmG/thiol:disulfide interchange protein DsbE
MTEGNETPVETEARWPAPGRRRLLWALLPLVLFAVIGGFLFRGLYLNPKEIPSALIDRPVPEFDLPALPGRPPGLKSADLVGEVSLVNVFASWCVTCRVEHPLLMRLKEEGVVAVHGLNYKDKPQSALDWLARFGDPYERVGADRSSRVGIDWGVYGVPETFVVDARGRIVCKHIGAIREPDLESKILPAIRAARAGEPTPC